MSECTKCRDCRSFIDLQLDWGIGASVAILDGFIVLEGNDGAKGEIEINYCPFCGRELGK